MAFYFYRPGFIARYGSTQGPAIRSLSTGRFDPAISAPRFCGRSPAIRRGLADGTVDPMADVKTLYYNTYDSILGVIQRMSVGVPSVHELDGHARIDALCEQFTRAFAAPPKQ